VLDDSTSQGPLLGRAGALSTELRLAIDYPSDGGIVTDAEGAFVAGRALALLGEFRRFDVMWCSTPRLRARPGSDVNEVAWSRGRMLGVFDPDSKTRSSPPKSRPHRVLQSFDAATRASASTFSARRCPPGTFVVSAPPPRPRSPSSRSHKYRSSRRRSTASSRVGPRASRT
jgi:hypothetical protein